MRNAMPRLILALAALLSSPLPARTEPEHLTSRVENIAEMRRFYGLSGDYDKAPPLAAKGGKLRVAILAKGFAGFGGDAHYLPKSTRLFASYPGTEAPGLDPMDSSGRRVGQLLWAMAGYPEDWLELRLYNARQPLNFSKAVLSAMEWRADIVVCLTNFETFGDFDGTGGVNWLVTSAIRRKILWIQSAGEFRTRVHNGPVHIGDSPHGGQWLKMRDGKAWLLRLKSNSDDNKVVITLSWNAFSPGRDLRGTDKDLDLVVARPDSFGDPGPMTQASRRQVIGEEKKPEETLAASERIAMTLSKRKHPYWIGVRYYGGKFSPEKDRFRLTITPEKKPFFDADLGRDIDPVELVDATDDGSIMIPADNPYVLTVGSYDPLSSVGTAGGVAKPEIKLDRAEVRFSDKFAMSGPDVAAAQLAALATVLMAHVPGVGRRHLLQIYRDTENGKGKRAEATATRSAVWSPPSVDQLEKRVNDGP